MDEVTNKWDTPPAHSSMQTWLPYPPHVKGVPADGEAATKCYQTYDQLQPEICFLSFI